MMKKFTIVSLLFLLSTSLNAQTNIPQNVPYTVSFQHDGVFVQGYRLYVDDILVDTVPITFMPQSGIVRLDAPAVSILGPHTIVASAFNLSGEIKSDPITVTIVPPLPEKPMNLTITVTVTIK